MEYLKNVVLKVCHRSTSILKLKLYFHVVYLYLQFLHTDDEERTSLIPVITKLLQLSQQERQYLSETTGGKLYNHYTYK